MFERCLCGSGLAYQQCCGQYHSGAQNPETAEKLMRSRFTAYAGRNEAYLLSTWDLATRPAVIDLSNDSTEWHRLEIINLKKGGPFDSIGRVEFKAFYRLKDKERVLHEISRFQKTDGRWFYLDGAIKALGLAGTQTPQGKNAPCPCGSGKKFKRCCGKE